MPEIVIIADDLTGANATGVLLSKNGFETATFLEQDAFIAEDNSVFNVISITTDSRSISKNDAYLRVSNVVKKFKQQKIKFFSKRIDSTLRGNIGAEMDAVLDNLSQETLAVVVPAFPASGRVTVGGYLTVNSVPLEKTDAAKDPKTPVNTSYVPELIKAQTKYPVDFLPLEYILKGEKKLSEKILESKKKGNKIIVMDASTDEEINTIAKAVKLSEIPIAAVDPGPFTAALALELVKRTKVTQDQKIMLTVGSVTNLTRQQLNELKNQYHPLLITVNAMALTDEAACEEEIKRVVSKISKDIMKHRIFGVITTTEEKEILDLSQIANASNITETQVSQRISEGLAKITKRVLKQNRASIGGLFTSGGDVTVAVCQAVSARGIKVEDEVLPLAVYGRLIGGEYDNMPIVTKGGLIGEQDAIVRCVNYLSSKTSCTL